MTHSFTITTVIPSVAPARLTRRRKFSLTIGLSLCVSFALHLTTPSPLHAQESTPPRSDSNSDAPSAKKPSKEQMEAYFKAAREGKLEEVQAFLAEGMPVDVRSPYQATALMFASARGQVEVVRCLLDAGADPNAKDNFYSAGPMAWAAMKQQQKVAVLLLNKGAKGADSALLLSVMAKDTEQVKAILDEHKLSQAALQRAKKAFPIDASDELKELFAKVPAPAEKTGDKGGEKGSGWTPEASELEKFAGRYVPVPKTEQESQALQQAEESGDFAKLDNLLTIALDDRTLQIDKGTETVTLKPDSQANRFRFGAAIFAFDIEDGNVVGFAAENEETTTQFRRLRSKVESAAGSAESLARDLAISSKNWMQFRGNGARGVAEGQRPPLQWDVPAEENVLWKTPVEGLSHSCPIIVGDRLLLTTAIGGEDDPGLKTGLYGDVDSVDEESEHRFEVHCYDKHSGELLWKRVACTAVPQVKRHLKGTHANATPATDGKYVVAFFGSEGLYCYRVDDGELVWKRDFGKLDSGWFFDASFQWGFASSPIVFGDKVIVQCDIQTGSFVAALDLATGNDVWRKEREEIPSWSTPTIVETSAGTQLITNATNFARAYDPRDGREIWRLGKNSEIVVPTPFTAHDLIYVVSGYRPVKPILAIRPESSGDISLPKNTDATDSVVWSNKKSGPYMVSPVVYGDYLYTCNSSGIFECLEALTGERVYRRRVSGGSAKSFVGSLIAGDGHIYIPSEEGILIVVKAGEEFEVVSKNPLGESLLSTPAISEGVMYIRGEKNLVAVGSTSK